VLDGKVLMDVDGQQLLAGEREAIAVPAQAWHRVANIGVGRSPST
jgi:mannose-6-phosphate isomerase-like protein (cupin superfamily)